MNTVNSIIVQRTKEIKAEIIQHFKLRAGKKNEPRDNSQCAKFALIDGQLANLVNVLFRNHKNGKLYLFGASCISGYNDKAPIRQRCCNCGGGSGVTYLVKNTHRRNLEGFLKQWRSAAEDWLNNGTPERKEVLQQKKRLQSVFDQHKKGRAVKTVGVKRFS